MLNYQKNKLITYGEQQFQLNYPNVGQIMEIENLKIFLTNGTYGDIARSGHIKGLEFLDMVDSFATISVLIKKINLKTEDFFSLDEIQALQLAKVYKEQIKPFFKEIKTEMDNVLNPPKQKVDEQQ